MKSPAAVIAVICLMLSLHATARPTGDRYDVPFGSASSATGLATITIHCAAAESLNRPIRTTCTIVNTSLSRPSPEAIAETIAAVDKSLAGVDGPKLLADLCKPAALRVSGESNMARAARDAFEAMRQACKKKESKAVHDAYLQYIRVDVGACDVSTRTSEYEFERKDLNTWISVEEGPESCPGTLTQTLWRDDDLWNFKTSRSFRRSPSQDKYPLLRAQCDAAAKTPVSEWSWKYRNPRDAGCAVIKM